ncbi:MAG: head-tail connector protein [Oscillospiraceae bacterium]
MKIKELSDRQILDSIGVSEDEANLLAVYKDAALQYIISHTALTEDEANEKDDLTVAYLCLIGDMFENRSATVQGGKPNETVRTILGHYDHNLI